MSVRMSVNRVAKELGLSAPTLRDYIRRYEKELVERGVLEVEERVVRKRYFVLVAPNRFLEMIRDLAKGE
jgi:DNA-binding Lrp family transcriptional regulator